MNRKILLLGALTLCLTTASFASDQKIQKQERKKEHAQQREEMRQQTKQNLQFFFQGPKQKRAKRHFDECIKKIENKSKTGDDNAAEADRLAKKEAHASKTALSDVNAYSSIINRSRDLLARKKKRSQQGHRSLSYFVKDALLAGK